MKEAYVILSALAMGLTMAALAVTYMPEADEHDPATEHAQCDTDTDCARLCKPADKACDGGPQP